MLDSLQGVLATLTHYIKTATFLDIFEVLFISFVVYKLLRFIHDTAVARVARGILWLLIMSEVSDWLNLNVIHFILSNTMQIGLIAILIMFQPEIRALLEQIGTGKLGGLLDRNRAPADDTTSMIHEVVDACSTMSWAKTGALIVFERKTLLSSVVTAATAVDARASSELVKNIFFKNSPLHDGAMVISHARIAMAGGVLPLSENKEISKDLGTRHRAGIGVTEKTDAVSVVVSEETGAISLSVGGKLSHGISPETLEAMLSQLLQEEIPAQTPGKLNALWKRIIQ